MYPQERGPKPEDKNFIKVDCDCKECSGTEDCCCDNCCDDNIDRVCLWFILIMVVTAVILSL